MFINNNNKSVDGTVIYLHVDQIPFLIKYIDNISFSFILVSGCGDTTMPYEFFNSNEDFLKFINNPKIITWDEEQFPEILNYKSRDVSASVMAIEGCDAYLSDILRNQAEGNFSRTTQHPTDGERTVTDLLNKLIDHRKAHLAQLRSVLAAL